MPVPWSLRVTMAGVSHSSMHWPGVIQPPDNDLFLGWLEDDPITAIQALQALWNDDFSAAARLQAFLDRVPAGLSDRPESVLPSALYC